MIVAGVLVLDLGTVDDAKETTRVAMPATAAKPPATKRTKTVVRAPGRKVTVRRSAETTPRQPALPRTVARTTKTAQRSAVERLLGDDGIVLPQYGVLLLAAFIAAAAMQRALVGRYGIKLAGLELAEIGESAADGLEELRNKLAASDAKHLEADAKLKEQLIVALQHVAYLEGKVNGK